MQPRIFSVLFITILISLTAGCVLNVDSDRRSRGEFWDESDLGAIRPGVTSSDWILRSLGEPSKKIESDEGKEIWQYVYSRVQDTEVGFIFLFHFDLENSTTSQLNVEISNDLVTDFWTREY